MTRFLIACFILLCSITACAQSQHIQWVDADLTKINPPLPLIMRAPKEWKVDYEIEHIISAPGFSVVIETSHSADQLVSTIEQRKNEILENVLYKFESYIIDLPDMIYYKVMYRGKPQYHFIVCKTIKGVKYYIYDRRDGGELFTRAQVDMMVEAANSISGK